jgi:hypothetical protein
MVKEAIIKIREKGSRGIGSYHYKNRIILEDPAQVACVLEDLKLNGANIEKSIQLLKNKKMSDFWR